MKLIYIFTFSSSSKASYETPLLFSSADEARGAGESFAAVVSSQIWSPSSQDKAVGMLLPGSPSAAVLTTTRSLGSLCGAMTRRVLIGGLRQVPCRLHRPLFTQEATGLIRIICTKIITCADFSCNSARLWPLGKLAGFNAYTVP